MATRKETDKLVKVTMNLFKEDWDYLKKIYTKSGASKSVRKLVRSHTKLLAARIKANQTDIKDLQVELDA